jgi:hypothetical protein
MVLIKLNKWYKDPLIIGVNHLPIFIYLNK